MDDGAHNADVRRAKELSAQKPSQTDYYYTVQ